MPSWRAPDSRSFDVSSVDDTGVLGSVSRSRSAMSGTTAIEVVLDLEELLGSRFAADTDEDIVVRVVGVLGRSSWQTAHSRAGSDMSRSSRPRCPRGDAPTRGPRDIWRAARVQIRHHSVLLVGDDLDAVAVPVVALHTGHNAGGTSARWSLPTSPVLIDECCPRAIRWQHSEARRQVPTPSPRAATTT